MEIIREGHRYKLDNFESVDDGQIIQFIEKIPAKEAVERRIIEDNKAFNETTMVTLYEGTTNEEVLEVLIDRLNYLNKKFACRENSIAITKLEEALLWLNKRTFNRIKRGVEGKHIK